jgi:hypothetical protein
LAANVRREHDGAPDDSGDSHSRGHTDLK